MRERLRLHLGRNAHSPAAGSNASDPLDIVNKGLREQPDKIRRDLQVNGLYGFTAMPCDSSKIFIFGVPLGHALKVRWPSCPKNGPRQAGMAPPPFPRCNGKEPSTTQSF